MAQDSCGGGPGRVAHGPVFIGRGRVLWRAAGMCDERNGKAEKRCDDDFAAYVLPSASGSCVINPRISLLAKPSAIGRIAPGTTARS